MNASAPRNALLKQTPSLLSKSFQPVLQLMPSCLDFDNKRAYFRRGQPRETLGTSSFTHAEFGVLFAVLKSPVELNPSFATSTAVTMVRRQSIVTSVTNRPALPGRSCGTVLSGKAGHWRLNGHRERERATSKRTCLIREMSLSCATLCS